MRSRVLLLLLMLPACKHPQPDPILQLQIYADLPHKLTFQYPSPWVLTRPLDSPIAAWGLRFPPSAVVAVTRADERRLAPTDFQAAAFTYAVRSGLTPQACAALAGSGTQEVGGTTYAFIELEASVGKGQRTDRIYSLPRGPHCFLFDLSLLRVTADGHRPMTAREMADIQTELTQLLASVSLQ